MVEHVPWRVSDKDPNVDGEEVAKEREAVFVPHRIMIKKEDLEKWGSSAGCPG